MPHAHQRHCRRLAYPALLVVLVSGCVIVPQRPGGPSNEPRPIAALDTVFLEEMTWMEVRDALKAGKTTALVVTGGVEDNGPYVATGKHDYIVRATAEAIARKLGNALVAPVVAFVPQGNIEPPTEHMKYPGTISVSEDTFERLLTDVCASLRCKVSGTSCYWATAAATSGACRRWPSGSTPAGAGRRGRFTSPSITTTTA